MREGDRIDLVARYGDACIFLGIHHIVVGTVLVDVNLEIVVGLRRNRNVEGLALA